MQRDDAILDKALRDTIPFLLTRYAQHSKTIVGIKRLTDLTRKMKSASYDSSDQSTKIVLAERT